MLFNRISSILAAVILISSLGLGCKKAPEPEATTTAESEAAATEAAPDAAAAAPAEAPAPPPAPIPPLQGAADVRAAVNRKDYMAAVQLLVQAKANATEDQLLEYNELMRSVKEAIVQDMATNPNAKQAFEALRFAVSGR